MWRTEFIWGYIKKYFYLLSFLNTEMTQVVEIFPRGRQEGILMIYPALSIPNTVAADGDARSQGINSHGMDHDGT